MKKEQLVAWVVAVSGMNVEVATKLANMLEARESCLDISDEVDSPLLILKQEPFACGYECCGIATSTLFLKKKEGGVVEISAIVFEGE